MDTFKGTQDRQLAGAGHPKRTETAEAGEFRSDGGDPAVSRRVLLAGAAAFAVGASAGTATAAGGGHEHHDHGDGGEHALIRAAADCQVAGEICEAHCQAMLAAGAPVSAHWFVDRQTGPLILNSGTEDMMRRIVPATTPGEAFFASACRSRTPAPISPRSAPRPTKWSAAGCSTATRFGPPAPIGKSGLRTGTLTQRH